MARIRARPWCSSSRMLDRLGSSPKSNRSTSPGLQLRAEVLCLSPHRISQRGSPDGWADTGVVVDGPGGPECTAGLLAFDDEGVQPGPSGVNGRGISGGA